MNGLWSQGNGELGMLHSDRFTSRVNFGLAIIGDATRQWKRKPDGTKRALIAGEAATEQRIQIGSDKDILFFDPANPGQTAASLTIDGTQNLEQLAAILTGAPGSARDAAIAAGCQLFCYQITDMQGIRKYQYRSVAIKPTYTALAQKRWANRYYLAPNWLASQSTGPETEYKAVDKNFPMSAPVETVNKSLEPEFLRFSYPQTNITQPIEWQERRRASSIMSPYALPEAIREPHEMQVDEWDVEFTYAISDVSDRIELRELPDSPPWLVVGNSLRVDGVLVPFTARAVAHNWLGPTGVTGGTWQALPDNPAGFLVGGEASEAAGFNNQPVGLSSSVSCSADSFVSGDVTTGATDADDLTGWYLWAYLTEPSYGYLSAVRFRNDGPWSFYPQGTVGSTEFKFRLNDGYSMSGEAIVSITSTTP